MEGPLGKEQLSVRYLEDLQAGVFSRAAVQLERLLCPGKPLLARRSPPFGRSGEVGRRTRPFNS